jgi:hypothetical protein
VNLRIGPEDRYVSVGVVKRVNEKSVEAMERLEAELTRRKPVQSVKAKGKT